MNSRRLLSLVLSIAIVASSFIVFISDASADTSDGVFFEILPELFINESKDDLFSDPNETVGVLRSKMVYGGPLKGDILKAWEKVAFMVYDEGGSLVSRDTGTIGDKGRWFGAKYIGPFSREKKYTMKIDTSTLPNGYYAYFETTPSGQKPEDLLTVNGPNGDGDTAIYTPGKNKFAHIRFEMDIVNISYTKNEDVAKNQFLLNANKEVTARNTSFVEGKDYIVKHIDKNGKFPIPSFAEAEAIAPEGQRPRGFYFYYTYKGVTKKYYSVPPLKAYDYSALRWFNGDKGINTSKKFKTSSTFTYTLDSVIPEVTFVKNIGANDNEINKVVATKKVYYKHSFEDNCIDNGKTCLDKKLPTMSNEGNKQFLGWNTSPDGKGQTFDKNTIVTANIKVYAQWGYPEVKSVPKTGDNSNIALYILILGISAIAIELVIKKRREN